jgi:hypothetical protein
MRAAQTGAEALVPPVKFAQSVAVIHGNTGLEGSFCMALAVPLARKLRPVAPTPSICIPKVRSTLSTLRIFSSDAPYFVANAAGVRTGPGIAPGGGRSGALSVRVISMCESGLRSHTFRAPVGIEGRTSAGKDYVAFGHTG